MQKSTAWPRVCCRKVLHDPRVRNHAQQLLIHTTGYSRETISRAWKCPFGKVWRNRVPLNVSKIGLRLLREKWSNPMLTMLWPLWKTSKTWVWWRKNLFGLTMLNLRHLVYQYCERNKIELPCNKKKQLAGLDWADRFMKRHLNISDCVPEATTMGCALLNSTNSRWWFSGTPNRWCECMAHVVHVKGWFITSQSIGLVFEGLWWNWMNVKFSEKQTITNWNSKRPK